METSKLLSLLSTETEVKSLSHVLCSKDVERTLVGGLIGSSASLAFAAVAKMNEEKDSMPLVMFVLDDVDEAGYFYHDLVQMLGDQKVLFFPSSYKRAIKYNQKDSGNEILRTEVLSKIGTKHLMVVTYPDAMAEKVVSKNKLSKNTIVIKKDGSYDMNILVKKIRELGFTLTDYVYEPGQFSVHGSILDVYSYSCENPYRVDFFGDDVDSIRTFDVQTQLSVNRVDEMTIVSQNGEDDNDYVSMLDFLPRDTVMVGHDFDFVCDKVAQIYDEGFSRQAVIESYGSADFADRMDKTKVMVEGEAFLRGMASFRRVMLRGQVSDSALEEGSATAVIRFHTQPQPLFHKNFELLQTELLRRQSEGYKIYIFADSEKQIDRLKDIFDEMAESEHQQINFEPVNRAIHDGFVDITAKRCFFTDHQIFDRFHKYNLKSDTARRGKVALTLRDIKQFEIGDYVVHMDHGIGRFGGLVRIQENGQMLEKIRINYANGGSVFVSIHNLNKVSKYKSEEGKPVRVNTLGSGAWNKLKEKVKTKVKDIARDLIRLYAQRRKEKGFAYSPDSYMQHELEASFVYEDTPDQLKATQDVKADMEKARPMDRLVCGDVGFGKTEVAVRAAFKAACDSKQVAVLVPTTVLAYQHYKTFSKRLEQFPVRVEYLSRARTAKATTALLKDLEEGKIDIIVGTQKLIGKGVKFKDLGLLIIDEEQKFGVAAKERLRQKKVNIDTLTMTATPIPRTLQFSLMGARDLSCIQTPPPNRYPIQTEIHTFSADILAQAINYEMSRNGQVFIVNNNIKDLPHLEELIHKYVPDARVCVGHGKMNPQELEKVLLDFMNYDYDVLLSTTIVENGIDVPNANTIIINSAQHYGLSDLHQMRGRVGRGNRKAFCYLLAPPLAALNEDSRRRLQAIENFSDLGSGIHIAMQDLDIRGAGNMLGAEQSGFIADLGYETYQKVLNEAVAELRETEFADIFAEQEKQETGEIKGDTFVEETNVECDIPAYLPEIYVPASGERMALYRELDSMTDQHQIDEFKARLKDRFGDIPEVGNELMRVVPIRWIGKRLGMEKISLKNGNMTLYFVSDQGSPFYQSKAFNKVIMYATDRKNIRNTKFREDDRCSLLVKNVHTIKDALAIMEEIDGQK